MLLASCHRSHGLTVGPPPESADLLDYAGYIGRYLGDRDCFQTSQQRTCRRERPLAVLARDNSHDDTKKRIIDMIRVALAIIATIGVAGSVGCQGLHQPFMHSSNCGCDSCASDVPGPPPESLSPTGEQHTCLGCGVKHGNHQARKAARQFARQDMMRGPSGPSVGAVSYPYYTTRGPRDFFLDDPQGIGP